MPNCHPVAKKRPYHHGDLRNALVQAAVTLISERRDTSFTMRELAAKAGASHAAAYRHFQAKRDILAAVAAAGFAELKAAFDEASRTSRGDAVRELKAQGLAYIQFAVEHPGHFRAMFHSELGDGMSYPELAAVGPAAFDSLLKLVTQGAASGAFVKRPPMELAVMAWASVHGMAMLIVDGRMGPTNRQATKALATLVGELLHSGIQPRDE